MGSLQNTTMEKAVLEATRRIDSLAADLEQAFNQVEQSQDAREISQAINQVNQLVGLLDGLARQLSKQMTEHNQEQVVPLLQKIASVTEQALTQSQQQLETAKQGILALRKTSAGVSAYHQIKKIR